MPVYTAAGRRHDHATFLERADVSVRCKGRGVKLLLANFRRGPGLVLFRLIRRKEYRQAVGMYYGLTWRHQAGYSLRPYAMGGKAKLAL